MKYDLLICNGRAVDPSQGLDDPRDIGLRGDKIVALGQHLDPREARESVNARGLLVTPGLIDCHVHVYSGVSHYGIDPDPNCLERGVTTAVDAGSAGAATWDGFPPLRHRSQRHPALCPAEYLVGRHGHRC